MDMLIIDEEKIKIDPETREMSLTGEGSSLAEGALEALNKRFKYKQYQALLMLTTILLTIEQLLSNYYNPNHLFFIGMHEDKQ